MTDHAWATEQIAADALDGLSAAESERLDAHVADCPDCAAARAAARTLDGTLAALFIADRPGPQLEDRMILALRQSRTKQIFLAGWKRKLAYGIAASVGLGLTGVVASELVENGEVSFASVYAPKRSPAYSTVGSVNSPLAAGDATRSEVAPQHGAVAGNGSGYTSGWREVAPQDGAGRGTGGNGLFHVEPETSEARTKYYMEGMKAQGKNPTPAAPPSMPGMPGMGMPGGRGQPPGMGGGGPGMGGPPPAGGGGGGGGFGGNPPGSGRPSGWYDYLPQGIPTYAIPAPPPPPPPSPATQPWAAKGDRAVNGEDATQYRFITPSDLKPKGLDDTIRSIRKSGDGDQKPVVAAIMASTEPGKPGEGKSEGAPPLGIPRLGDKPGQPPVVEPASKPPAVSAAPRQIVIRSGDIEFEIESFDSATAAVTLLANAIKGAFVATVNSDKLPNGKVKGSLVVRLPPEALDTFVLDLRKELGKTGELKGVRLASQDITKQYTDLESRLKAARAMELRLLQMIKDGKGEIKQLLEAEKELGVWRTKIEESEGELRYFSNLASLSTLTITLTEREIKSAAGLTESEKVQAGIEVEEVDQARRQIITAITDAKGRVLKSELKQHAAGQFNAALVFEVPADAAGPLLDRMRQLGRVVRLEIDRVQTADGSPTKDAKVKRGDAHFQVQLYNLANIAPRETVTLQIAAEDVPATYRTLREAVAKVTGRVLAAKLDEQDKKNVAATFDFEVKRTDEGTVQAALGTAGDAISRNVSRAAEGDSVTDSKVLFRTQLISASKIAPRETATVQLAADDVPAAYRALREAVTKAKGRILTARLDEQDKRSVTATLDFEVKRNEESAVQAALTAAGDAISRNVSRAGEGETVTDNKVLYRLQVFSASRLSPRETTTLALEVTDVDSTAAAFAGYAAEAKARTLDAKVNHERDGRVTAHLTYEVPLSSAATFLAKLQGAGIIRLSETKRDPNAPDGKVSMARLDVTLANGDVIVAPNDGIWPKVRQGLAVSATVLLTSVTWVVVGLCVVLPWALVGTLAYKLGRRFFGTAQSPTPST